jgi:hypothetical protein
MVSRPAYYNPTKETNLPNKSRRAAATPAGETQDMAFLGILSTQLIHHQYIEDFHGADVGISRLDKRIVQR